MNHLKDETGNRYGLWTVTKRAPDKVRASGKRCVMWVCRCDCGTVADISPYNLRNGQTRSCGCNRNVRHGLSSTLMYIAWIGMVQRCTNPNHKRYHRYGGRGVTVCKRWLTYENFLADMGERPKGMTVERKDNNKGYGKNNCEWATYKKQAHNTSTNHRITYGGETLLITEWSRRLGGCPQLVTQRLAKGWDLTRAVTTPARRR